MLKSKIGVWLVATALLGTSMASFAQSGPDHHDDGHGGGHEMHAGGPGGHGGPDHGGPVPHRDWHNGDRLPSDYRQNRYVVGDWHQHGLRQPPRGYHWVNVNGDYVLAGIATGVIASIMLAH